METKEKKIIKDYLFGNISKDDVLKQFPIDLSNNSNYIFSNIENDYKNKDSDGLEYSLLLIIFNNSVIHKKDFVKLMCALLKETWHYKHEDIVSILQNIKSPESVDCLYKTALSKFDYLSYNNSVALAIKCIHALAEINSENAREKLQSLAQSDDLAISEKAKKQLNYLRSK